MPIARRAVPQGMPRRIGTAASSVDPAENWGPEIRGANTLQDRLGKCSDVAQDILNKHRILGTSRPVVREPCPTKFASLPPKTVSGAG
jgi:hypothetical protein